jgi:site-specific DNA-methyltransferase (adenine-specific)
MKTIFDQINNNEVLIYPENVTAVIKQIDTASFTNDQALNAYFPEDTYEVIPEIHFDKVEIGDGNFIYHGDNMDVLRSLPDNSIDSIVTDPPYGLKFMKEKWDHDVPSKEFWKECLRVIKPGGYVLSFGGCKTYHRMVVNVEDAGFEIRDCLMWIFGEGMPKSHNVGLRIDKSLGYPNRGHRISMASRTHPDGTFEPNGEKLEPYQVKSEEAKPWSGWGTNLKPAYEPILMARKPFKVTVAKNVLKWGTGGINIDACRINNESTDKGRFPANIFFDEEAGKLLDIQSGVLKSGKLKTTHKRHTDGSPNGIYGKFNPEHPLSESYGDQGGASRFFYCAKANKTEKEEGLTSEPLEIKGQENGQDVRNVPQKLRTTDRKNTHKTVKPVLLMQYLIRLVTPLGGITLDPYFGSGSTGKSIVAEGDYKFIGIEKEKEYFDIAVKRCQYEFDKCNKTAA